MKYTLIVSAALTFMAYLSSPKSQEDPSILVVLFFIIFAFSHLISLAIQSIKNRNKPKQIPKQKSFFRPTEQNPILSIIAIAFFSWLAYQAAGKGWGIAVALFLIIGFISNTNQQRKARAAIQGSSLHEEQIGSEFSSSYNEETTPRSKYLDKVSFVYDLLALHSWKSTSWVSNFYFIDTKRFSNPLYMMIPAGFILLLTYFHRQAITPILYNISLLKSEIHAIKTEIQRVKTRN